MPASGTIEVTIDAVDAPRAAQFWADALGYEERYRRGPYIVLGPLDGGDGPLVLVQAVDDHPTAKTRVHLDLRVADPESVVKRLAGRGGSVRERIVEAGRTWTVMEDPEGVVFCVCPMRD